MTHQALEFLTALGTYGGVFANDAPVFASMAAGIATSLGAGWVVDTVGSYRMTFDGEAALYTALAS